MTKIVFALGNIWSNEIIYKKQLKNNTKSRRSDYYGIESFGRNVYKKVKT